MPLITTLYTLRQPIKSKVSGRLGYIDGFCRNDGVEDQYRVLFVNGEGDRATAWFPEHELELLGVDVDPPFPSPWPPASGSIGSLEA